MANITATAAPTHLGAPAGTPPPGGDGVPTAEPGIDFLAIQRSPEFVELRRKHRRFDFPICAAFFG